MSIVVEQLKKISRINFDNLAIEAIKQKKREIVQLNRDQLRKGQSGSGTMPTYPPAYENYKRSLPSYFAGGRTDLYLTGSFQEGMDMRLSANDAEIYSKDKKESQLLERYGEEIFELNENFRQQAYDLTTPVYFKLFHDKIK